MAIAYDSSVDGGNNGGSNNNLTFAFNNVAGNILFVAIIGDNGTNFDDITGVTYAGVSLSLVGKDINTALNRLPYLYMLPNPATGSNNVVVNSTNNHYLLCGAISYSGAATAGQPDASVVHDSGSTNVNTLTSSLTSIANNCWHMLMSHQGAAETPTAGAGTTGPRVYEAAFSTWGLFDSNTAKTPPGSVSLTTSITSVVWPMAHIMATIAPPPVAAPKMPSPVLQAVNRASYF